MPFDPILASRVREILSARNDVSERKMFGGLCFMVAGHMCCGLAANKFMVRVGPAEYGRALALRHAQPMDFTGRPLMGFVYVAPAGLKTKRDLARWLAMGVDYVESLPAKKPKAPRKRGPWPGV